MGVRHFFLQHFSLCFLLMLVSMHAVHTCFSMLLVFVLF